MTSYTNKKGEVLEPVSVLLRRETKAFVDLYALKMRKKRKEIIEEALENFFKEHENNTF